ncbi:MAG TPA: DNA-3-methyladenine glycosylase [Ilumatobacteraceae bacterium]|nr:DNA-3-methyladenine glycosylase [Ilumatobacteraceae bacterium]
MGLLERGSVRRLRRTFFARASTTVAPELLNKLLVAGGSVGRIVEVEAYMADDPASHAFRGQTRRNATMFGKAGVLYVYFTYGMHHCANVVTGSIGDGQAVLLRAVTPVAGIDELRARRPGRPDRSLADGPGKLCQAFGLDLRHDGLDLCASEAPVWIGDDGVPPPAVPLIGQRVGISVGVDLPWRWRIQ